MFKRAQTHVAVALGEELSVAVDTRLDSEHPDVMSVEAELGDGMALTIIGTAEQIERLAKRLRYAAATKRDVDILNGWSA